jgi:hypothetical protein
MSVALIAGGLAWAYVDRHLVPADMMRWNISDAFGEVVNLAIPIAGFVVASRRPANRVGWLFLVAGLALGLSAFSQQYGLHALIVAPGSLPAGWAFVWLSNWTWVIAFAMLAFVFLLFPTGRLRSRRWLPAAWFAGGALTLTSAVVAVYSARFWSRPFSTPAQAVTPVVTAVIILVCAVLVVSVAAVVVRFARSSGEERLQLKWFAAAALLVVATFILSVAINSVLTSALSNVAFLCLWVAVAVAVLKYRLYDIDVVISKAVLYGSLAVSSPPSTSAWWLV